MFMRRGYRAKGLPPVVLEAVALLGAATLAVVDAEAAVAFEAILKMRCACEGCRLIKWLVY